MYRSPPNTEFRLGRFYYVAIAFVLESICLNFRFEELSPDRDAMKQIGIALKIEGIDIKAI